MQLTRFFLIFALIVISPFTISQTNTASRLSEEFVGAWLVTVAGESRSRTLKVRSISQRSDGLFDLDAIYGYTDEGQGPIRAELNVSSRERTLTLTTQADTKIVATQDSEGKFSGTFTLKNGQSKKASVFKLSDGEMQLATERARNISALARFANKPTATVPAACAAFFGSWNGKWSGSSDELWLRVMEVNEKCVAKYTFGSTKAISMDFLTAEIHDGVLTFSCSNGTCNIKRDGQLMNVHFWNSDIRKQAILQKVEN